MIERDDPAQHLGFLVHDVARLLRRNFNRRVQHLGLTQAQWRTLVFLARNQGCNQVALADILEVQPITLARLLDRLQAAGFIERQPDPTDRRAFQLYLTEKAQPVLAKIWELGTKTREEALSGLPRDTRETLAEALQAMRSNLLSCEHVDAPETDTEAPAAVDRKRAAHA